MCLPARGEDACASSRRTSYLDKSTWLDGNGKEHTRAEPDDILTREKTKMKIRRTIRYILGATAVLFLVFAKAHAQKSSEADIRQEIQNPVGSIK